MNDLRCGAECKDAVCPNDGQRQDNPPSKKCIFVRYWWLFPIVAAVGYVLGFVAGQIIRN